MTAFDWWIILATSVVFVVLLVHRRRCLRDPEARPLTDHEWHDLLMDELAERERQQAIKAAASEAREQTKH